MAVCEYSPGLPRLTDGAGVHCSRILASSNQIVRLPRLTRPGRIPTSSTPGTVASDPTRIPGFTFFAMTHFLREPKPATPGIMPISGQQQVFRVSRNVFAWLGASEDRRTFPRAHTLHQCLPVASVGKFPTTSPVITHLRDASVCNRFYHKFAVLRLGGPDVAYSIPLHTTHFS
jgi:hypothetical protein